MTVYTKAYNSPAINEKEILRYAGISKANEETQSLLNECLKISKAAFSYKVCYAEFDINCQSDFIDLTFATSDSKDLRKILSDSKRIILFAATVGTDIDRLIARHSAISPAKAFMLQAIGAERIEALCDIFEQDIKQELTSNGYTVKPRFSAGYGDIPLELQRDIVSVLDCQRKIGITLNESLVMSPSKSVTAMIGIKGKSEEIKK